MPDNSEIKNRLSLTLKYGSNQYDGKNHDTPNNNAPNYKTTVDGAHNYKDNLPEQQLHGYLTPKNIKLSE